MRKIKVAQMAACLIILAGEALDKLRLLKLLYLAERESLARFGYPIANDEIRSMKRGLVMMGTLKLMSRDMDPVCHRYIMRGPSRMYSVVAGITEAELDSLSEYDLQVLNDVWAKYQALTGAELADNVHHALPEWTDPGDRSDVPVSYAEILEGLGRNRDEAADLAADIDYFRETDQLAVDIELTELLEAC